MKVLKVFWKNKDRTGLMTDAKYTPYVICTNYDPDLPEGEQWINGNYYSNFVEFAKATTNYTLPIGYARMEELASRAIDGLVEDDKGEAYIYFRDEMEMDADEMEYFGLNEIEDEYEEEWEESEREW